MESLKKYRVILTAFLILQIMCLIFVKYVVFNNNISIVSNNLFFFFLLILSLIPYIVFYFACYKLSCKINQNNSNDNQNLKIVSPDDTGNSNKSTKNFDEITLLFHEDLDLRQAFDKLFSKLSKEIEIVQGVAFIKNFDNNLFEIISTYAFFKDEFPHEFEEGEGIPGQVAKTGKFIVITDIPENYINVISGLGKATPRQIIIFPVMDNELCISIIELAFFKKLDNENIIKLNEVIMPLGTQINRIIKKENIYDK